MKISLFFALLLVSFAANAIPANIQYLNCSSVSAGTGTTTVTFLGNQLFNISNIPVFGFPFTQNATLTGARYEDHTLILELHTLITNADLQLTLTGSTSRGYLVVGQGQALPMNCSAKISRSN